MKNVIRVLKRDILRLLKVPQAMVVIITLLVLPSLYTWCNVLGFWNPYESTDRLAVCVVNEDKGAQSKLTGAINVGDSIAHALKQDHQLDWRFVSYDEAMQQVESGESYAAFVIPEDFSDKLLTISTGNFEQPDIDYYVNEKFGPIAPKITNAGATTLDDKINSTFVETVAQKATEILDSDISGIEDKINNAQSIAVQNVKTAKESLEKASQAMEELSASAQTAVTRIETAKNSVGAASTSIDDAVSAMNSVAKLSSTMQSDYKTFAAESVPLITQAMQDAADAYTQAVDAVYAAYPNPTAQQKALLAELKASANQAQISAKNYSTTLSQDIAPALGTDLGEIAVAASEAAGALSGQKVILSQAVVVMDSMVSTLESSANSLDQTHSLINSLIGDMDNIETDTMMLAGSSLITKLLGTGTFNAKTVAEFISDPTVLVTKQLYPVSTYGEAMAPLFMNLTFWIGAFMLMIIIRQEVDATGIKNLTLTQRYISRFLLCAILAILQAVICCAGLPFIGMQIVNLPALFFAAIVAALAYLGIIYSLSVTLQHIGKGLCLILVFAQIPASTGLYPIEMTATFFRVVYPALPFTYGISAMREAICGFYGLQYLTDILTLLVFFIIFMAAGILLRTPLSNVNRMFAQQISASGIFNGETSELPEHRFRISQMLQALADKKEYREIILRRYQRFENMYPKLILGAIIGAVCVPVLITVVFSLGLTGKAVLLIAWLFWIVLVFLFLTVIETLKQSFASQLNLDEMDDDALRSLYLAHKNKAPSGIANINNSEVSSQVRTLRHKNGTEEGD